MIGRTINNYEVRRLIGEGGMGSVYLAEHPVLRRMAAVKVLKREYAERKDLVVRFINEARAAAAVRHPNVIEVLDVGTLPGDGLPYMMMEYLEGETLARRITRVKQLSVGAAVDLATQAAAGLAATHAQGVVHRDLKPENLFLARDPGDPKRPRVKVLDFGIAKLRGDISLESVRTQTGAVFGTPIYMAPEQCRGLHEEVDARSDVYGLGVILFEALCGRPPFVARGWGDLLMLHMNEPPPVPSSLNPRVPPEVDAAILRALAKKKEDRYQSMAEMAEALARAAELAQATPAPSSEAFEEVASRSAPIDASVRGEQVTTLGRAAGTIERATGGVRRRWSLALGAAVLGGALFMAWGRSFFAAPPRGVSGRAAGGGQEEGAAGGPPVVQPIEPAAASVPLAPAERRAVVTPDAGVAPPPTSPRSRPAAGVTKRRPRRSEPEKW